MEGGRENIPGNRLGRIGTNNKTSRFNIKTFARSLESLEIH